MDLTTVTRARGERSNASSTRARRAVAAARIKTSSVPTALPMPISRLSLSETYFPPHLPIRSSVGSLAWKITSESCNLNFTNTASKARRLALPSPGPAPFQTEHGKQTNPPPNTTSLTF